MTIKVGSKVKIKDDDDKIFIVTNISRDREGNDIIDFMVNWEDENDYSDISLYPEELEEVE